MKYLSDARSKMSKEPSRFAEQEPFLFNLLNNATLTKTESNVLLTELFQGGIDAVTRIYFIRFIRLAVIKTSFTYRNPDCNDYIDDAS